ncbi:protein ARV1-like [Macrobrachium nipponense]|uniref:protein ARV1-like n=1 Tax=Macrobrachium nipponense TaxID=159736 RepID=UPI0030C8115B
MTAAKGKEYICINCTSVTRAIYKKSDGNFIKLLDCDICGQPVDRYVECEKSIIFMDLVLQDMAAYRHILFNADDFTPQFYTKLALSLMLSEAYVRWVDFAENLSVGNGIRNNEVYLYIMCLVAASEIGMFGIIIWLYSTLKYWNKGSIQIYNACLLGQCGRLANIAAIIWYQSSSLIFQVLMLAFVLVSSIQSIRAALNIGRVESCLIITTAFVIGYSAARILEPLLINTYQYYYGV